MLNLNLLPIQKKKEISRQIILASFERLISIGLIIICAAGIVLLGTKLVMQDRFDQAVSQAALVTKEYGTTNQKVHLTNQKIDFLYSAQSGFIEWSPKLAAFSTLVPSGIELYSLDADYSSKDVQIAGLAKTRDNLLLFKKNLEDSDFLKSITFPIENLLEAENINFKITGQL